MDNKVIYILGGGTVWHIRNHFALCSPAYGATARQIAEDLRLYNRDMDVHMYLTKMAGGEVLVRGGGRGLHSTDEKEAKIYGLYPHKIETNEDASKLVDHIVADPRAKVVFFNFAMCDFEGYIDSGDKATTGGKHAPRLDSHTWKPTNLTLLTAPKVIRKVREKRKDIFLVAFKATCGATEREQYVAGLRLLKEASANLVLANDTLSRLNMVITPEEASYHVTNDRDEAINGLVDMAIKRSHLTFTRSTVVDGQPVPWDSPEVPEALRVVVDHCISGKAYKPFRGSTVGHFAAKLSDNEFLTSIRKTNFNDLAKTGLVRIKTDGPDSVMAYGAKPSVGGQSQRIVFHDHQDYDCIVHFHCPLKDKPRDEIPVASQREYECGSHQCGQNTSTHLKRFGNLSAVMLDQHGPNIVFHRSIDPKEVIAFIEANFDLDKKTGGYVSTHGDRT